MNIENLKVGMEFKNYKALCEALGEPVKTGKSKQLQLKQWQEHFTWTNIGNKFIISTIGEKNMVEINICQLSVVEGESYSMEELVKYFLDEEMKKGGNSYTRQRAQVECYGKFVYQNGKWLVKEIYDIEIERKDGRKANAHDFVVKDDYTILFVGNIEVLIDTEDLDKVLDYHWYLSDKNKGKNSHVKSGNVWIHRLVMGLPPLDQHITENSLIVHHKNRNPLDNRKRNLVVLTEREHAKLHVDEKNKNRIYE